MRKICVLGAVLLALGGCDERGATDQGIGGIHIDARQWECESEDDSLTCTAAAESHPDESGAYACMTNEENGTCPPVEAIDVLADAEIWLDLEGKPWACLLTGEHQRQCLKEIAAPDVDPGSPDAPGDPGEPGGDDTPSDPGGDTPDPGSDDAPGSDTVEDPSVPTDCGYETWEAYFCQLSSARYQAHGVDVTFPCDIFDADGIMEVPTDVGSADPDAPTCHDGEWDMREQAWLDAVSAGCMNLNNAILVMCQQAANYAPEVGACRATGTW